MHENLFFLERDIDMSINVSQQFPLQATWEDMQLIRPVEDYFTHFTVQAEEVQTRIVNVRESLNRSSVATNRCVSAPIHII
jgi:hypothetical protein